MVVVFLTALALVFWVCVFAIGYTYAGYPLLLRWLAKGKELPLDCYTKDEEFPEVAVLMAVYNEEAVLEKTLASVLASRYPADRLRVYLGSDGSTDRSHEIVQRFQSKYPNLNLTVFEGRNGKIRIMNYLARKAACAFVRPEEGVFVLCDANVSWSPFLLRNVVGHFKREKVGLVAANVLDSQQDRDGIGDQEDAYVGRENLTKYHEGVLWGAVMGAFGACYAMRATVFRPVPERYIVDDFFLTMTCLEQKKEAIVDLDAECYEAVSTDIREEFRRKRRIATGNFQNLAHFFSFYLPWNGGPAVTFAFWSHKGLRWIGPVLLIGAFVSSMILSVFSPFYALMFLGFLGSFAVAGLDRVLSKTNSGLHVKLFRFVRYFYSMNLALLLGLVAFLKGGQNSVWEPTRRVVRGQEEAKDAAAKID